MKGNATLDLGKLVATPALARELFYSPGMPEEDVERYAAWLGGELDAIFSPAEIRKTAKLTAPRRSSTPTPPTT